MIRIDDALVDSAISIKNEFEKLRKNLAYYETEAKILADFLLKISNELEEYVNGPINQVSSVTEATKHILDKMVEMETESDRIYKFIEPINLDMEKLKRDENELYLEIKRINPNATDAEIITNLTERMKKTDT